MGPVSDLIVVKEVGYCGAQRIEWETKGSSCW